MTVQERLREFDDAFIKEVSEALNLYFKPPLGLVGADYSINLQQCTIASDADTGVSALGESSNSPRPLKLNLLLRNTPQGVVDLPFTLEQKLKLFQTNQKSSIVPSFQGALNDAQSGVFNSFDILVMAKMMKVAPNLITRERDGYARMAKIPGINTLNVIYPPQGDGLYGNPDRLHPMIITEFRKGLRPSGSLGTSELFDEGQFDEQGNEKRPVYELLMEQMAILHNHKFIHGDAKLDNFGYLDNELILLPIDPQGKADFSKIDELKPTNPEFSRFYDSAQRYKKKNNLEGDITADEAMYEGIIDDMARIFNSTSNSQLRDGNPKVIQKAREIFHSTYLSKLDYNDEVKKRIEQEFEDAINNKFSK